MGRYKSSFNTSIARSLSFKVSKISFGDYDDFWKRLADKLMLDELLAGEADPTEFLKDQIQELCNEIKLEDLEHEKQRITGGHRP